VDRAAEAVEFARANYRLPNLWFEQASCAALPHPDGRFDLVVAFEVIEHLKEWREFLLEVRRLLAPGGQFIVSTPNRLYYTESRGEQGVNPFHVHEFAFEEFRTELKSVFPYVSLFLENHVAGVTFQPHEPGQTVEVRVDAGEPVPDESHFFVAVCAHRPQLGNPIFVYVPRASNVLREREHHIRALEMQLAKLHGEHDELERQHELQGEDLERSNRWAQDLNRELEERRARVVELQDELVRVNEGYTARVQELENDVAEKMKWALDAEARLTAETQELARAVEALHGTEKELEERTVWALRLQDEAQKLEQQLALVRASRWVKLGRSVGLGPVLPPG
jgi:SAM-dependent methyltransferase